MGGGSDVGRQLHIVPPVAASTTTEVLQQFTETIHQPIGDLLDQTLVPTYKALNEAVWSFWRPAAQAESLAALGIINGTLRAATFIWEEGARDLPVADQQDPRVQAAWASLQGGAGVINKLTAISSPLLADNTLACYRARTRFILALAGNPPNARNIAERTFRAVTAAATTAAVDLEAQVQRDRLRAPRRAWMAN